MVQIKEHLCPLVETKTRMKDLSLDIVNLLIEHED